MTEPFVGALVRGQLLMKRAAACRHDWSVELDNGEVQCSRCTIIATNRAFANSLPFGTQSPTCHAARDGECAWAQCPQLRDGEPRKSGRHCPLDHRTDVD